MTGAPTAREAYALTTIADAEGVTEKAAALLVAGGLQYGVGRMIQTVAELRGSRVAVFTEEGAALDWLEAELGLDDGPDGAAGEAEDA
jgi:hypothetical protein